MADQRSSIFKKPDEGLNEKALAEFKPKTSPPAVTLEVGELNMVAEKTGFVSRENRVRKSRRFKSGRNVQLSIKVTQASADMFYEVVDELAMTEDPKTLGQVFERAIKLLYKDHRAIFPEPMIEESEK